MLADLAGDQAAIRKIVTDLSTLDALLKAATIAKLDVNKIEHNGEPIHRWLLLFYNLKGPWIPGTARISRTGKVLPNNGCKIQVARLL